MVVDRKRKPPKMEEWPALSFLRSRTLKRSLNSLDDEDNNNNNNHVRSCSFLLFRNVGCAMSKRRNSQPASSPVYTSLPTFTRSLVPSRFSRPTHTHTHTCTRSQTLHPTQELWILVALLLRLKGWGRVAARGLVPQHGHRVSDLPIASKHFFVLSHNGGENEKGTSAVSHTPNMSRGTQNHKLKSRCNNGSEEGTSPQRCSLSSAPAAGCLAKFRSLVQN